MTDRKKPASKSPTQRTLDWLRKCGYTCAVAEKLNPWVGPPDKKCASCGKNRIGIKQDLFGFIDVVAVKPGVFLAVQCTSSQSGGNLMARVTKIVALAPAKAWVEAGGIIWAIGWRKLVSSNRWEPDIRDIKIGDFE